MTVVRHRPEIIERAPLKTWFRVGGRADRVARVRSAEALREAMDMDPDARIIGDGANLIVDDDGVGFLVVELRGDFEMIETDAMHARVRAGAGVRLPRLINETVRSGLGGLEALAGIPASVGGAAVMNAGGSWGEMGDVVESVAVLRGGSVMEIPREQIAFGYRCSGLEPDTVVSVTFALRRGDAGVLDARRREIMEAKVASQPMSEKSAGCCFKNPVLERAIEGIGGAGDRVGAGLLIDRAGGKGMRLGGAEVSAKHANFITVEPSALASDAIGLMDTVRARVADTFGVALEREVVVWGRGR